MLEQYKSNGLILKDETTISSDNLVRTYTMWWSDREGLQQYNNEPEVKEYVKAKGWYDTQNDMHVNIITKTVEDFDE